MPDVSILIVCYNSRDLISECLRGLYEHTRECDFEVLLVDCSDDGTSNLVRAEFPQVTVLDNSKNLGFGGGNNLLAEHAKGSYLILVNPDVIISDNAIGTLYQTAVAMPKWGAIGGRTKLPNGSRDPSSRQCLPTLCRLLVAAIGGAKLLNGALPENAKEAAEVEILSGAFMLVRADAWRDVAGFDTSFFMYSEEVDLCHRLRQKGWAVVMTPHAEVIHLVGGGDAQNPRRIQLLTTARMHFFRKFWSPAEIVAGGVIMWVHGVIRITLATCGGLFLGKSRAQRLRLAYSGIVFHPKSWWYGFSTVQRK